MYAQHLEQSVTIPQLESRLANPVIPNSSSTQLNMRHAVRKTQNSSEIGSTTLCKDARLCSTVQEGCVIELTGESQAMFVVGVQSLQKDARPLSRHHQAFTCTTSLILVRCRKLLWSHTAAGNTGWPHILQSDIKPQTDRRQTTQ